MQLVSWIGATDLRFMTEDLDQAGPIGKLIANMQFTHLNLLVNYPPEQTKPYKEWLAANTQSKLNIKQAKLKTPTDFNDIYLAADKLLSQLSEANEEIAVLLSPGTPAMQAIWILLGKTKYDVTFYQVSREQGIEQVEVPFEISAEFIPKTLSTLSKQAFGEVDRLSAFDAIVTQNAQLIELKEKAAILAGTDFPVLIYGESGTGKELFATAIHNASNRNVKNLITVNCGAIPEELIDSLLFGHKKGAFTGAIADKQGFFQQANGGTLFLDEFGELPESVQVRLLRVLQSGELTKVGDNKTEKVKVRIIAATNKDLMQEVAQGRFREDLFYRVAVGVLKLPPIRERKGDLTLLADKLLADIYSTMHNHNSKKISVKARNFILKQYWRGNVRELQSTLMRAALWSQTKEISLKDIENAMLIIQDKPSDILGREIAEGLDLHSVMGEVVKHYIPRAMAISNENKTKAAKLLGLPNYQTLGNWIEKYEVK
ncbi:sigma-54 interaction domain-containing protein [Marinicellulosiphila megalodicopiae]|uniref:sigma-54 interaction domain-containing protein n=1 Tax=Marinicellulosiphila megalodicopiae TaxID=2724896 RepID=UPI003BB1BA81